MSLKSIDGGVNFFDYFESTNLKLVIVILSKLQMYSGLSWS